MTLLPDRTCTVLAATTIVALLFSGVARAQEAAPADESLAMPETYLDPLKAVESDEAAFVEQLWSMGNAEFEQIDSIREKISRREIALPEAEAAQREILLRIRQLKTLADYAVQRYGQNARVRNFNGNVFYDALGQQEAGLKEWHTAVSLDRNYSNPYNNLGMHYFHIGRYPLGFQNMDKALDLEPKNPDFCFNMAQNYLIFRPQTEEYRGWSAKKVYKEAMKLSKKATKLAPDDYELLEDYAVNFLAAENFGVKPDWKGAIAAWRAAREHAQEDVDRFYTWLNEGRMWRELDKSDEALRCFREALALQPGSKITQRLISELEADG